MRRVPSILIIKTNCVMNCHADLKHVSGVQTTMPKLRQVNIVESVRKRVIMNRALIRDAIILKSLVN